MGQKKVWNLIYNVNIYMWLNVYLSKCFATSNKTTYGIPWTLNHRVQLKRKCVSNLKIMGLTLKGLRGGVIGSWEMHEDMLFIMYEALLYCWSGIK